MDSAIRVETEELGDGSCRTIGPEGMGAVARFDMRQSWHWDSHVHDSHQLLWAPDGGVTLQTERLDWLVPATMALFIPAGIVHGVAGSRAGSVHILWFDPVLCPRSYSTVTPLAVDPLARELLLYLDDESLTCDERAPAETVLHAAMKPVSPTALHIPIPTDPRAREVADAIIADPADAGDLAEWAWRVHSTERTLRRLFADETSMGFTQWRLHVRVRAAMQLLAAGHSVGTTARKVGYSTTAAFVTAFGRVTGTTPATHRAAGSAVAS